MVLRIILLLFLFLFLSFLNVYIKINIDNYFLSSTRIMHSNDIGSSRTVILTPEFLNG